MSAKIEVFITKYALTSGIKHVIDAEFVPETNMVFVRKGWVANYYHGEGREWHRTRAAAVTVASAMRDAKVASLRKQIAKIEALSFS